ncbi:MAG: hypothetical protein ACK4MF_04850, partial [Hyphomicrobiaceae bacterium]
SESDQRQSSTLASMQARLDALSTQARSYRGRVPDQLLPAFERIEDGVAMLAERIASVRHEVPPGSEPMATKPVSAAPAPAPTPAPAAEMRATITQPEPQRAATIPDPDIVLANDEYAWDRDAADALVRHYETGAAAFVGPTPDPERVSPAAPRRVMQAVATKAAGDLATDVHRAWLEERFADIARRVEESLGAVDTDAALDKFSNRFDKLEERFGSALDGIATRTDVESLGLLEAHIAELTQQFDEARSQLGRLDGIEQTLAAVVDRLTDPRFDDILARGAAGTENDLEPLISAAVEQIATRLKDTNDSNQPDFASLADAAAERVATRFADLGQMSQPAAGSGDDMNAVRQLLEHFINERREGDEQTAAMLDTMQQAMIRMLDRIDAMEVAHSKAAPQEYVREQVRFGGVEAGPAGVGGVQKAVDAASAFASEARGTANYEPRKTAPVSFEPAAEADTSDRPFANPVHKLDQAPADAGRVASASNKPQAGQTATIERLRHDFIAEAQRAKQKATEASLAAGAQAATATGAGAAAAAMRKPRTPITEPAAADTLPGAAVPLGKPRPRVQAVEPAAEGSRFSKMPSRKILVSALVLLVAIPGIILLTQKRAPRGEVVPATAIEVPAAKDSGTALAPAEPGATTQRATNIVDPHPSGADGDRRIDAKVDGSDSHPESETPADRESPAEPDGEPEMRRPAVNLNQSGLDHAAPVAPAPAAPPAATRTAAAAAPAPAADVSIAKPPVGIHVATPARAPTLEQISRLRQRQEMAELSSQLGAAQQPSPTLAALIPGASEPAVARELAATGETNADKLAGMTRKALELPPASVGPLSLRMAAANADPSAEFEVGARFAEANGVQQNFEEAARWYQRSATQGFVQSQYRLATLYERGLGVKQDLARAKVWYQRAAEGGNVKAMHNLAVLSAGKTAKTPDYTAAAQWFTAAAERGLADSQFNLAVLLEGGLGVAKDMRAAYKWYAIAARSGDQEAVRRRDELERALPVSDVSAARNDVNTWRAIPSDRIANDARAAGEEWKARASASGAI